MPKSIELSDSTLHVITHLKEIQPIFSDMDEAEILRFFLIYYFINLNF